MDYSVEGDALAGGALPAALGGPSSCISSSGQQGQCGVAPFLGLCAGLQEKQPALARHTQNEFLLSLKSTVLDPIKRIKTTKISCLTLPKI